MPYFLPLALSLPSHPSVILPSIFDLPLYRNVTSVICYVSTPTSTCPASSYDDIHVLQNGWSPLYAASEKGHLDVVKTLLEAGANINQANNVGICTHT